MLIIGYGREVVRYGKEVGGVCRWAVGCGGIAGILEEGCSWGGSREVVGACWCRCESWSIG